MTAAALPIDRWIAVAPLEAKAALRAFVYDERGRSRFVRREWPWQFHGGKSWAFETSQGAELAVVQQTMFGCFVLSVENDREGLVARIEEDCALRAIPVENVGALARRFNVATSDGDRLSALFALAAAQSVAGGVALPALEAALRRALDDANPVVRLAAVRATAALPPAAGLALLDGRSDGDNPGLIEWREHYRALVAAR